MSILSLQKRQRELGRLRLGTKGPKGNPVKLDTWRLTSPDRTLLVAAADEYGGTVEPWNDQYEVITDAEKIPVMIPPQDMDRQQSMELWAAGGLVRRCDGKTCHIATDKPGVMLEQPCLCADMDSPECKPSTTVRFWLPELPALGVWILTSTGWNAASELAADVEMLAGKNVTVHLAIEQRESKRKGQPLRRFVVPVIQTPISLKSLLGAGEHRFLPPPARHDAPLPPPAVPSPRAESNPDGDSPDGGASLAPVGAVGEELKPTEGDGTLIPVAERAIERYWNDLTALVLGGPPVQGTMEVMEAELRRLFRLLEQVNVIESGEAALHKALGKRGVKHVGDLKRAELLAFIKDAWPWAEQLIQKDE